LTSFVSARGLPKSMSEASDEPAMPVEGLITLVSRHGPEETMDRLIAAVTARGATILSRIDHAAAAASGGLQLRPTEVAIFGNPRAGTPLMRTAQTMGINLPLRALIWQDEAGTTQLCFNDPGWLAERHGAEGSNQAVLRAMADFLATVSREAAN
jgi:uncharacterized protein (DUF302 family)